MRARKPGVGLGEGGRFWQEAGGGTSRDATVSGCAQLTLWFELH
jgi:hypothetical protein